MLGIALVCLTVPASAGSRLDCVNFFRNLHRSGDPSPALSALEKYAQNHVGSDVSIARGRATVRINYVGPGSKRLLGLVSRAIEEGTVKAIHTNIVAHPKVLLILEQLRRKSESHPHQVVVKGLISRKLLMGRVAAQRAGLEGPNGTWSEQEMAAFDRIVRSIALEKCGSTLRAPFELCSFAATIENGRISVIYSLPLRR